MRPAPLPPEDPEDSRGPCLPCVEAVKHASSSLPVLGAQRFAVYAACACEGRPPRPVWEHSADILVPAASVAKLALTHAVVEANRRNLIDLTAPVTLKDLPGTRFRDSLAALPPDTQLSLVELIGLGLTTSANPIFDYLYRIPAVVDCLAGIEGVQVSSGFSDLDLDGPVYDNLITASTTAGLLVRILRYPDLVLAPLRWGLANGSRTTRLVRDMEGDLRLPEKFYAPNKTGTLATVKNDVAAFTDGDGCLVVAVLAQTSDPAVDTDMANLGSALAQARFSLPGTLACSPLSSPSPVSSRC